MPTPKNAPYKIRQRTQAKWFARIWDHAKAHLSMRNLGGQPGLVVTRSGQRYVIDPVTGQWWREAKWQARQATRR